MWVYGLGASGCTTRTALVSGNETIILKFAHVGSGCVGYLVQFLCGSCVATFLREPISLQSFFNPVS